MEYYIGMKMNIFWNENESFIGINDILWNENESFIGIKLIFY